MPGYVQVETEGRVAIVTIRRSESLNALNSEVVRELTMTFERLSAASEIGAIVLTGAGDKAFVAGADIKEMVGLTGPEMERFSALGRRLGEAMAACPKAIIAAINGFALGGGCELAMACDLRVASDRARIGQPEINLGILAGFGGTQRLPRLVGPGWASLLLLTGDPIDATSAERIGLVEKVVPHERLLEEAKALGAKIASKGAMAVSLTKACVRAAFEMPLAAGLRYETAAFGLVGGTRDKEEGMRAFLEKRAAVWTGS